MSFHDLPTGGHFGSDKMFRTMLKRFECPGMKAEIAAYVCAGLSSVCPRANPQTAADRFDIFDELVPDRSQ